MHVVTISVPQLGNRCHLVHDGSSALVIDPPRDPQRSRRPPRGRSHDRRGRGHPPAQRLRLGRPRARGPAPRRLPAQCGGAGGRHPGRPAGRRRGPRRRAPRRGCSTPPGTPSTTSRSWCGAPTRARRARCSAAAACCSARSGRTDLVDRLLTRHLGRAQWESARRLATLDDATSLHPTHGFGSFCAGGSSGPDGDPTIAGQRRANPVLQPGARRLRRRPGGGPRPGAGVLPADGAAQPARGRGPTDPPTRARSPPPRPTRYAASAAGSSTCAAPRSTPRARCPGR